ncbi:MAG: NUDIX hydrolase [Bifidobacteriaceae bacterium]|jgi:8-oxo-dGTP diphosphatase|nr:NUDIX hydrolase [Bifidobacteriaceae bacterium]
MPAPKPRPGRYRSAWPIFYVTCDLVVFTIRQAELNALLVRRAGQVKTGWWALPGGFVRELEDIEETARRELQEEAGIEPGQVKLAQLGAYGSPDRDPDRLPNRVVTVAWAALGADLPDAVPGTDTDAAGWFPLAEALRMKLAFDHRRILEDGLEWARRQLEDTTLATSFCRPEFTLPELMDVYRAVWGYQLDPRNFYRKAVRAHGFVEPTGDVCRGRGRPARVYRAGGTTLLYPAIMRREPSKS